MANPEIQLYNFYRRYRWRAEDFLGWQKGMVDHSRGMFEGIVNGAVLAGFGVNLTTDLEFEVSEGIASGPTGYLHVINEVTELELEAATGSVRRDLVVVRPNLVDNEFITRPTNPFDTVPLRTAQESAIVVLKGVESNSPTYPATEPNDVVLFGVRVEAGQTTLTESDLDFEVRDLIGKNSNFQQDAAKFDDRLRPFKVDNKSLGIKPSQLEPPFARVFSYVNKSGPSIFPKDIGGLYNPADTFLNFETGVISGGDEASANFTPTIPTAGAFVVASVSLRADDTLVVAYGTEGTREQCFAGIKNQAASGAGSVLIPSGVKPIAFVVLGSEDGLEITELDFFDCRGVFGVGENASGLAGAGVTQPLVGEYPLTLTDDDDGRVILVDTTAPRTINAHNAPANFKITFKDISGQANTNPITFVRFGAQEMEGLAADYLMESDFGSWSWVFDGNDWLLI